MNIKIAQAATFTKKEDTSHKIITALPLIAVNLVAISGQFAWAKDHLHWGIPGQFLFAIALESIAIFLSYHAYLAEKSNDSAFRLKIAAYTMGLLVGLINYSHWSNNWRPTDIAIVTGMMSALSPWLWATYSRRVSRKTLSEKGLIDEHALRLGMTRWIWHPLNSFKTMRMATWTGQTIPTKAIAEFNEKEAEKNKQLIPYTPGSPESNGISNLSKKVKA